MFKCIEYIYKYKHALKSQLDITCIANINNNQICTFSATTCYPYGKWCTDNSKEQRHNDKLCIHI